MTVDFSTLSKEQKDFLALFRLFGEPVSIFSAGALSPILPGPFLELVSGGEKGRWLVTTAEDEYSLSPDLPDSIIARLDAINSADRIKQLIGNVESGKLINSLSPGKVIRLLESIYREGSPIKELLEFARSAALHRNHPAAMDYLTHALNLLSKQDPEPERDRRLVSTSLELSNLHYTMGKGQENLSNFLFQASEAAKRIGDKRSFCLMNLHIGRLLHVSGQHAEALTMLSSGLKEAEVLGDEDIRAKTSVFSGLYYYIQGRFREALPHFQKSIQLYQSAESGLVENPSAPVFLGYSAAYLGHFAESIGSLDANWKLAVQREDMGLATIIRSVLGTILVMVGKERAAKEHLDGALQDAKRSKNLLATYLAEGGHAVRLFLKGDLKASYQIASKTISKGTESGFVRQYTSPWILEMFFEYHRNGYQIPGFGFKQELSRVMRGSNIHLKGVGFRLHALSSANVSGQTKTEEDLNESLKLLEESGDRIQLEKTRLAIARLKKENKKLKEASELTQRVAEAFTELNYPYFPDDLKTLLPKGFLNYRPLETDDSFLNKSLEMVNFLSTAGGTKETLLRLVRSILHLTRTENGGLFWSSEIKNGDIFLRAGVNLSEEEINTAGFKQRLELIKSSFRSGKSLGHFQQTATGKSLYHVICLPVTIKNETRGVFAFTSSYLSDSFHDPGTELLDKMAAYFSACIKRILEFGELRGERNLLASEKSLRTEQFNREEILAESPVMIEILERTDQVAQSDSTVLILGESGVGKELLARRLHKLSQRSSSPYIVVDITGIPENLLESELFGHEKGAFTGADKQKQGRLELANRGTLFIDEIGEISKSIQVKLLRALQEKTFVRVGGTRTITSDFRLITATNRDLEEEVLTGQFREDLYYRLNVLPIVLPPLRERDGDILLLARYFWNQYLRKYNRENIQLTAKDEKKLRTYDWPGNIRELKNVIERAAILSSDQNMEIILPPRNKLRANHPFADNPSLNEVQRRYIRFVLEKTNGKISGAGGATELLGIKRQTLYARMKKLGLR